MSDLLTQDEIDILLSGVEEGDFDREIEPEAFADEVQPDKQIRSFDFTGREKKVLDCMPVLERVNDRFAAQLRCSLSRLMSCSPEIEIFDIQMQPFSEFVQGLQLQTSITAARFAPLRGRALITMEPCLVFAIVDNYFGGFGQSNGPVDYTQSSPIVTRVIRLVIDMVFKDLKEAWKPVTDLNIDYLGSEINSKHTTIESPSEIGVISTIHIRLNRGEGNLNITLPYSMVEPFKDLPDGNNCGSAENDSDWEKALCHQILRADVGVSGLLAEKTMTLRDVLRIKKGDMLPIEMLETVILSAEGIPIYESKAGISDGHYALRIIDKMGS